MVSAYAKEFATHLEVASKLRALGQKKEPVSSFISGAKRTFMLRKAITLASI